MESLAESKTRKQASLIDYDESLKNSKKQRSSGSYTLQYLREKAENDRIKKTGAWISEAGNDNASYIVSTDSTTVRANDGHNAAVITKETVNTCI